MFIALSYALIICFQLIFIKYANYNFGSLYLYMIATSLVAPGLTTFLYKKNKNLDSYLIVLASLTGIVTFWTTSYRSFIWIDLCLVLLFLSTLYYRILKILFETQDEFKYFVSSAIGSLLGFIVYLIGTSCFKDHVFYLLLLGLLILVQRRKTKEIAFLFFYVWSFSFNMGDASIVDIKTNSYSHLMKQIQFEENENKIYPFLYLLNGINGASYFPNKNIKELQTYPLREAAMKASKGKENMLVLCSGAGLDVALAKKYQYKNISAIEVNNLILDDVLKEKNNYYQDVVLRRGEARKLLSQESKEYDNIFLSLCVYTHNGHSMVHSYHLTKESLLLYKSNLKKGGVITILLPKLEGLAEKMKSTVEGLMPYKFYSSDESDLFLLVLGEHTLDFNIMQVSGEAKIMSDKSPFLYSNSSIHKRKHEDLFEISFYEWSQNIVFPLLFISLFSLLFFLRRNREQCILAVNSLGFILLFNYILFVFSPLWSNLIQGTYILQIVILLMLSLAYARYYKYLFYFSFSIVAYLFIPTQTLFNVNETFYQIVFSLLLCLPLFFYASLYVPLFKTLNKERAIITSSLTYVFGTSLFLINSMILSLDANIFIILLCIIFLIMKKNDLFR